MSNSLGYEINRSLDSLEQLQKSSEFMELPMELKAFLLSELKEAVIHLKKAKSVLLGDHPLEAEDRAAGKQDVWERRLLDLSFRNALLHIREGKRAVILHSSDMISLMNRLISGEEIPVADLFPGYQDFERNGLIKGLFRLSRTALEENGANTLFLAFGILRYDEDGPGSRIHQAPISLLPVDLIRSSKEKYIIRRRDEDFVLNITLLEYLKQTLGIDIFPDSFRKEPLDAIFTKAFDLFKEQVSFKKGWGIEEKCVLGVFSFTKFLMWNDIHTHREALSSNLLLRSLIEGRLLLEPPVPADAREMDKNCTPDLLSLPVDYDSSQFEAVAAADQGTSFVLYGPPGTGKSQTITNIIANALYKGKRVLFVAEKKAALEVVQRRLENIGIGPFCLELHGNKIDRRYFLSQMERVLFMAGDCDRDSFMKSASDLYSERMELIRHIESLHSKGNYAWTLNECIERYLSIPGSAFELPAGWTENKDEKYLDSIREICLSMDAGVSILGMPERDFPLTGIVPKKRTVTDLKNLEICLKEIPVAIDAALKQESSDMNRKYLKKSFAQILNSDYRWRRVLQVIDVEPDLLEDPGTLRLKAVRWAESLDLLPQWLRYMEPMLTLNGDGLEEIVKLHRSGLSGEQVFSAFSKSFFFRAAKDRIDKDPSLSRFNGMLFSHVIDKYREENARFQELSRGVLLSRLISRIPHDSRDPEIGEELTYLRKRIASKGRGTTIRGIIDHIPHLFPLLCPCLLMSPISVAQYIAMDGEAFDMVIFDEASQMPTSEAVGSIARGKSVIVVGDPKQMPPTDFFSADAVDEEEYEIDDLDSILDDCIALSLPPHHLKWHYRSQHESLISFSNNEFYGGSLVTFPSVDNLKSRIVCHHVDGIYDYGRTRTNRVEAEAIVKEVLDRLRSGDNRSIGIVAFNKNQSDLIEDILLDSINRDKRLESRAFSREEPVFVKNLENVQGDERDVVLFSIGYGPDENGNVSMNFGPLSKAGGERRLNVALTRARNEMVVFSSLSADQIDPRRTRAEGALGLKRFLEYADHGSSFPSEDEKSLKSEMLVQIETALRSKGYIVHSGIGASSFRVDLAVVDSANPEKYQLGIIIDGEDYYRLKTVGDREIVRPSMLKKLGWKLLRVWILEWFLHPQKVLKEIIESIDNQIIHR